MSATTASRYLLSACAAAGVLAAVASGALLSVALGSPERTAAAISDGDLRALLGIVSEQLVAALRQLAHYL